MTYIELINEFWKHERLNPGQALDAKFYFYLLDECNRRKWTNPFELRSRITELSLMITRKTIGEVRNRLKQKGLIDFVSAPNKHTVYRIINAPVSADNPLSDCFPQVTMRKPSKVQSGNTKGDNPETCNKEIRIKKQEEKTSCEVKKKTLTPTQMIDDFRRNTENQLYSSFLDWVQEKAPYVAANIGPLSEQEFEKLRKNFGTDAIAANILNIENRKDLRKKYNTLYRTLINWCKNDYNN